ncbi:MAG TPA: carbohydrate ABC transporter permease [Solirubrobacteraceae bacterium]|nr:carbohydrate ABC transporter permease [Solirubrobacteraceae bacterium]
MSAFTSGAAGSTSRGRRRRRRESEQERTPGLFGVRSWTRTRFVLACVFAGVAVFPLLYMVSLSFQPTSDILRSHPTLIPSSPTTANYVQAWTENDFSRFFFNSLAVSFGAVVITVVFASLAAFAFARYEFRFKELIFYLFLASLAVPSVDLIIPQYILMARLHLTNSLPGLSVIYASENLPFSIFLLRGFFEAIPKELEESFRLEGAGTLRVLTRLIAPLSAPALAVVAVFTFNFAWEEFVIALTLIDKASRFTLPIGLNFFIGEHTTQWGPLFAGSMFATVPSILIYVISQRWFRRGVSVGGIR